MAAYPNLVDPNHLKNLQRLTEGVSSVDNESSLRAKEFSVALSDAVQHGHTCTAVQACAAVMAQIELLVSEAELARKHRSKVSVPSVSEIDALRPLLDFIDLLGGSHGELKSREQVWDTLTRGPGLLLVREQAERAHSSRRAVKSNASVPPGDESASAKCSDGAALAVIFNAALRLIAANLALSIHVDDALEVDPVENLERARGLLRAVVSSGAESDYFGSLSVEEREEVREQALVAYDVGGEAFFKDAAVMMEAAKGILQRASRERAAADDTLDIAVLRIFARPPVLLPLLLSEMDDVRGSMVEIVETVSELQFRDVGQDAASPGDAEVGPSTEQSSNLETVDADWNWGLCHRESIDLTKNDRRAYKSNSYPDYSCAMSSEAFTDGVHSWEVHFESTCSTWVGIADESTKDYLGSSPVINYGATLHCGGSWNLYGGLTAAKQESASFGGGTKVSMVLDFNQGTFDMFVDGVHKLSVNNIESDKPLHAYVCMDGSGESFELLSATRQTSSTHCKTQIEAVRLVGNQLLRLQTGILASPTASARAENYGGVVLAKFCSQMEALKADVDSGRVSLDAVRRAISRSTAQLAFENVYALACKLCGSYVAKGNFGSITQVLTATHGLLAALRLDEEHWMWPFVHTLASMLGPEAAAVIWGEPSGETGDEEVDEDWLQSPLFSKGLLATPTHTDLLVAENEASPFDGILQPRVAVHASPYLDRLERDVIIAILYHVGAIDQAVSIAHESSEEMIATCQVRMPPVEI